MLLSVSLNSFHETKKISSSSNKMLSGKFLITLLGILMAIFAICNLNLQQPVVEGWWGGAQFGTHGVPGAQFKDGTKVAVDPALINQKPDMMGSGKFISTPQFQAMLTPRFSNVNYGAYIKYNPPARERLGTPCDPLTFGDYAGQTASNACGAKSTENFQRSPQGAPQVKENYDCANCGSGSCGGGCGGAPSCGKGGYGFGHKLAGGYELAPNQHSEMNNWQSVYDSLPVQGTNMGSDLPIGTMDLMDGAGNVEQAIIFERLMPFNLKGSRLASQGDFIRGDLAIAPQGGDWFATHPNLSRDLQVGALGVMFGMDGSNNKELMQMVMNSTGRSRTTMSGVDLTTEMPKLNPMMANQVNGQLLNASADISYTGFP